MTVIEAVVDFRSFHGILITISIFFIKPDALVQLATAQTTTAYNVSSSAMKTTLVTETLSTPTPGK